MTSHFCFSFFIQVQIQQKQSGNHNQQQKQPEAWKAFPCKIVCHAVFHIQTDTAGEVRRPHSSDHASIP